jgi:hypothetical protein
MRTDFAVRFKVASAPGANSSNAHDAHFGVVPATIADGTDIITIKLNLMRILKSNTT